MFSDLKNIFFINFKVLHIYLGLVHPRVGHIEPDPLPEGTGDGVCGVDPAVRVQHILQQKVG
jgi:hypothetical protein